MMRSQSSDNVTLKDVANAAGVSLATASRAINGSPDRQVRPDLRMRVLETAARLHYQPNAQAQAMARGWTDVIGLVVHDIADPYFSSILSGVMQGAESHGLLVTVASTGRSATKELQHVASFRGQRARAVILAGSRFDDSEAIEGLHAEIAQLERAGGRAAFLSQHLLPIDTVVVENRASAQSLARQLVELGYKRFAVLAGPDRLMTSKDRAEGFMDGLLAVGAGPPVAVAKADFSRDGGYDGMVEILASPDRPDLVFAVNDVMAVGAMAATRDQGLTVPQDVAVAGFDDIVTLRDVTPPLTTVRLPLVDLGRYLVEMVLQPREDAPRVRRVRGEVIIRESTPPIR
ncbi:MAG: LacI family DNA-binding transcriptional regulator [Acidimicrobiia bacterium]